MTNRKSLVQHAAGVIFSLAPLLACAAGTWQKSLEGIDLDSSQAGFEAYYDKALNITWLANVGAVQGTPFAWINDRDNNFSTPLATFDNAQAWVSGLSVGQVTGWRLPTPPEINSMFFRTLGNKNNLLTERGPFINFAAYRPYDDWIGIYLWSGEVNGSVITVFGMDGTGWNTALSGNPMIAWAVHDGKPVGSISGKSNGLEAPYSVECRNDTTGQMVKSATVNSSAYDCKKIGLTVARGDLVTVVISGVAK